MEEEKMNINGGEVKKGPWTRDEDQKLRDYIHHNGHGSWRALPAKAGLQRCGKSCRLRWTNYLRPDIKRGKFSPQEEKSIIRLHALLGNRWSAIATHLPKRTDNEIKNYWNTRLKKRLTRMGIDPMTHKPRTSPDATAQSSRQAANLDHMAQWETARLEAEARLVRESKLLSNRHLTRSGTCIPPTPPPLPCLDVLKVWQATAAAAAVNGFFRSVGGTLDSPTSPLNFAGNMSSVPTVSGYANDFAVNNCTINDCDFNASVGSTDLICLNQDGGGDCYDMVSMSSVFGDHVEDNKSYWIDLLNLVSSPVIETPAF